MVCSDWERTLSELEASLRQDPKDSSVCRRLADAYAVRGRLKDTVSTYLHLSDLLQAQGDSESALQISGLVLQLQPQCEEGRLRRIHLFEQRQDEQQTIRAYRELAQLYVEQGRGQQAIELLERSRRALPDNLDLLLELAETHTSEGQIGRAISCFEEAADRFLERADRERACQALRRVKILSPSNVPALLQLGKLYLNLERLPEAEQELRGVLRQNLNHEEALMRLGQVCQLKGQGRDACLAFQRLISLNPECWDAYEHLAQVLQSQGLAGEAVHNYLRSAEGHLAQGEREKAVRPLRMLLALEPEHPGAVSHLATLDAPLQPLELELPPAEPTPAPPSTPSGELRLALKRRELPGKNLSIKPLPGTRPAPKIALVKPVLVKTAVADQLPDFEGSNDWLNEAEEDQFPEVDGSCAWLEEALPLFSNNWAALQNLRAGQPPQRLGWPGRLWTTVRFGKWSEELEFWADLCSQNPANWQLRAEWAEACLKVGICDQAIELYREVVGLAGDQDEMRHRLIQALIWNDEMEAAAQACLELAELYRSQGELGESLETLQLLLQLDPQHLAARRRLVEWTEGKVSRHHLGVLAEQAYRQQKWDEALRAGQQLLELGENDWKVRRRVQRAAEGCDQRNEALFQARLVLEQLCQAGEWQEAAATCEELMAWEPGHTRLWVKLLEECAQPERLAAGRIRLAQELIESDQREQAMVLLAESSLKEAAAAEYLLELLWQDGDARAVALGVRRIEENLRSDQEPQALELCTRLLQKFPEAAELQFALGEIHRSAGRWELALEQFQRARRHSDWLHKATYSLALCLNQRKGMEEVARRQVERALQVPGKPEELEALRSLLDS